MQVLQRTSVRFGETVSSTRIHTGILVYKAFVRLVSLWPCTSIFFPPAEESLGCVSTCLPHPVVARFILYIPLGATGVVVYYALLPVVAGKFVVLARFCSKTGIPLPDLDGPSGLLDCVPVWPLPTSYNYTFTARLSSRRRLSAERQPSVLVCYSLYLAEYCGSRVGEDEMRECWNAP